MNIDKLTKLHIGLNILSAILIALSIIIIFTPKPDTIIEYIPQEVIVERVIQNETIAVDRNTLFEQAQRMLGNNYSDVISYLRDQDFSLVAVQEVSAQARGETIIHTVIEHDTIQPIEEDLDLTFINPDQTNTTVDIGHLSLTPEGVLTASTYDTAIGLTNLISLTSENTITVVSDLTLTVNNIDYDIPINATVYSLPQRQLNTKKPRTYFDFWDPHLHLGISLISNIETTTLGVGLDLSIATRYKDDIPLWRILMIGGGYAYSKDFYLQMAPVAYNIGNNIPLISDLWLSANIIYSPTLNWGLSLALSTTL